MNPEPDADVVRGDARAQAGRPERGLVTTIDVGEDTTVVASGRHDRPEAAWRLAIGSDRVGRVPIDVRRPSAPELERAIEAVEDAVMPLARVLPAASTLVARGRTAAVLARAAGIEVSDGAVLARDEIERAFDQVAAVAQGRPVASSGLPPGRAFALTVLIVREIMHHLGFGEVVLGGSRTQLARLKPSVATNASSGSRPRRITVKSACICSPGAVSKRTTGSGVAAFSGLMNALSCVSPPA